MPAKLTDIEAASGMLGVKIEDGVWFDRFQHRWYHNLSTGTELDLILIVFLLPWIAWRKVFGKAGQSNKTGPVFVGRTDTQLVFFAGSDGVFRRHVTEVDQRMDISDIRNIACDNSKQVAVTFEFVDTPTIQLYYTGPRQSLEEFISHSI